jgi:hypothetical protein
MWTPITAPVVDAGTDAFDTAMTNAAAFLARSLSSLLNTTFAELSNISSPDIASRQFVSTYAAGSGIAMFVLVLMLARVFYRTASGEMSGQALAESLWRWAPGAMMLVLFAPGLGQLTVQLTDAATVSIIHYFDADVGSLPGRLASMVVIDDPSKLPGGPMVALLVMAVALVGVIGLVGGLVAQTLVLYLTGAIMAIAFVAMIDPVTRSRAMRLPSIWLALLLAKPLLFFLIGVLARIAGSAFTAGAGSDPGWKLLMPALMGALALLFVGLAPWSIVKITPRLPAQRTNRSFGRMLSAGAAAQRQAPSTTMLQMSYRRMHGVPAGPAGSAPAAPAPGATPRRKPVVTTRSNATSQATGTAAAAQQNAPTYAAEPAPDTTTMAPFGEQAIDMAPPPLPELLQRGGTR